PPPARVPPAHEAPPAPGDAASRRAAACRPPLEWPAASAAAAAPPQPDRRLLRGAVGRDELHPAVDPQPAVLRAAVPGPRQLRGCPRPWQRCPADEGTLHPGACASRSPGRAVQNSTGQLSVVYGVALA